MSCCKKANYDFIVVGMGASGATILRYLYDAGFSVLGIEAGGNYNHEVPISNPTYAGTLEAQYGPNYFWQQQNVPNFDIIKSDGSPLVMNYTTGRGLGGGTFINGIQYVRSDDSLWNKWAEINGPLWNANAAQNGYQQLENFLGTNGSYNSAVHGSSGKMDIRQAPVVATSMATKFATALSTATNTFIIDDYNNPETPIGTFTRWSLFQQPNTLRASSSTDFLEDIIDENGRGINKNTLQERNLQKYSKVRILLNATANKVIFKKNKAIGVSIIYNGKNKTIYAKYEIILSAGIHSNEILQRSGVGASSLLNLLHIPVVFDNPNVGVGSKNHLINIAVFSANPADFPGTGNDPNALYVGGAFLPNFKDLQNGINNRGFQWIGIDGGPGIFIVVFYNLDPHSIGTDTIQNKDPLCVSLFSEKLFSDPLDLQRIIDVYQQQIAALNTAFSTIDSSYALISPSLDTIADTAALTQYIKDSVDHAHHWTGTCSMKPLEQGGVVNNVGEVHGVRRLRVADISVAPISPNGNTAGPAFFVGYNIAQQIIAKYKDFLE
jgi:choline dehydrogenase